MFLDVIGELLAFRSGVLKVLHGLCADLASRSHRVKLAALGLTFEGHIKASCSSNLAPCSRAMRGLGSNFSRGRSFAPAAEKFPAGTTAVSSVAWILKIPCVLRFGSSVAIVTVWVLPKHRIHPRTPRVKGSFCQVFMSIKRHTKAPGPLGQSVASLRKSRDTGVRVSVKVEKSGEDEFGSTASSFRTRHRVAIARAPVLG